MSEKKMIGRNVAIALGIVTIVLLVGLVGAIANYTFIINEKDNIITSKDSQIQTLTSQNTQLQAWLQGNITYYISHEETLQNQISSLNFQIIQLEKWLEGNKTLLTEVKMKNEDYLKALRLQKVIWLEHDRVFNIPPGGRSGEMYFVPWAGIITISFSATGNVYFVTSIYYEGGIYYADTGETPKIFPPVNITYRYPESMAVSSGIFSFPVLPQWASVIIVNPSTTQGVSVLITVKYTY